MAPEQMAEPPEAGPAPPPARPLDAIDQDILQMLQADGRASIRSVAERVHVSRANAYARINRLIEDGVIRGFGARVDHERAGQGTSAYITLKIVQNSWRTVREQLRRAGEPASLEFRAPITRPRRIVVLIKGDTLLRVDGDVMPKAAATSGVPAK